MPTISTPVVKPVDITGAGQANALTITSTGSVKPGTPNYYGATAVTSSTTDVDLYNSGNVTGGVSLSGGTGGSGVYLAATGYIKNYGSIDGGAGNLLAPSTLGGTGGQGVRLNSGTLANFVSVEGGSGTYGGDGGVAVTVNVSAMISNDGKTTNALIAGGSGQDGGSGGTGIVLNGGAITNGGYTDPFSSTIEGGSALTNGSTGNGGTGIQMGANTNLTNNDQVSGGAGGSGAGTTGGTAVTVGTHATVLNYYAINGGYGSAHGGAGVTLGSYARLTNYTGARISGGNTLSGQGGVGVDLAAANAYLNNSAKIYGGVAEYLGGTGVDVSAATTLINAPGAKIQGGESTKSAGGAGVYLNGGAVTTSGEIWGGNTDANSSLFGDSVKFGTATGGTLTIDSGATFEGNIADFKPGDTIDVTNLTFAGSHFVVVNGYETLSTPEGVLTFSGLYAGEYLKLAADSGTGTEVTAAKQSSTIDHAVNQTVTLVDTPSPAYPQYASPLTITATGSVDPTLSGSGAAGVFSTSVNAALTNYGAVYGGATFTPAVAGGIGVDLQEGGTVTNDGAVTGGTASQAGDAGGSGLVLGSPANNYSGLLYNDSAGRITGGTGGYGSDVPTIYQAGGGGTGAIVNGAAYNSGRIVGGVGGASGGQAAGTGGTGLQLSGGTTFSQNFSGGQITGGAGGLAGATNAGGTGGIGLDMNGWGLTNFGTITGGRGGAPHYGSSGGDGGAGASFADTTTLFNHGDIAGGAAGGYTENLSSATGGVGIDGTSNSQVNNQSDGTVTGGTGGFGGGGAGGGGVVIQDSAYLKNYGRVYGGAGGYRYTGPGGNGGAGVSASDTTIHPSTVFNSGTIEGGTGGNDEIGSDATPATGVGGFGGVGVALTAAATLNNIGTVKGGWGGYGGYVIAQAAQGTGGAGGVGVTTVSFTTVNNLSGGTIIGGHGAYSGPLNGGAGAAAVFANGGAINNYGAITGGFGGNVGNAGSEGGAGGTGVELYSDGAVLVNNKYGTIKGGASGGYTQNNPIEPDGVGGTGVYVGAGTSATNYGAITGGAGGLIGNQGNGGDGVLQAGGTLTNTGAITGGTGGGQGIQMFNGVANTSGDVTGGSGGLAFAYETGGAGVYVGTYAALNLTGGNLTGGAGVNIGAGGAGLEIETGASVQNATNATITGGAGGNPLHSEGAEGGVGIYVQAGAYFSGTNLHIFGGVGGTGGYTTVPLSGGYGGTGINIRGGTVTLQGFVTGGAGGDGGFDPNNSTAAGPGFGGIGVYLDGGTLNANDATFSGGNSGSSVYNGYSVRFGGPAATLNDSGSTFNGTISGFRPGDTIDLEGVQVNDAVPQLNGNAIIYAGPDGTLVFQDISAGLFRFTGDGSGGTDVTIACYLRGTRIRAARGDIAIENLRIGDEVMTLSGALRPIRWIGRRSYSAAYASDHREVLPVLITQGALGDHLPRRDLRVSPEHAMWIDGVLIPAAALINGHSILQLEADREIAYYHVEFDSHCVIYAEGAPSESFIDDDSRLQFDNAAEFWTLYPQDRPQPALFCAPRVEDGEVLETVRARLQSQALPRWQPPAAALVAVGVQA